jgi:hypothetical protein
LPDYLAKKYRDPLVLTGAEVKAARKEAVGQLKVGLFVLGAILVIVALG